MVKKILESLSDDKLTIRKYPTLNKWGKYIPFFGLFFASSSDVDSPFFGLYHYFTSMFFVVIFIAFHWAKYLDKI